MSMLNQRIQKKLYVAYLLLLVIACGYAKFVLSQDYVDIEEKDSAKKTAVKRRFVDVTLEVYSDSSTDQNWPSPIIYKAKKSNQDSVLELLKSARSDGAFSFEITSYIDQIVLDQVNHIFPQPNERWAVFDGKNDITQKISSEYLQDNKVYTLKLVVL